MSLVERFEINPNVGAADQHRQLAVDKVRNASEFVVLVLASDGDGIEVMQHGTIETMLSAHRALWLAILEATEHIIEDIDDDEEEAA